MTNSQRIYLDGWRDATECICNAIYKASQNPQLQVSKVGREMSSLLLEVTKVIEANSEQVLETLLCQTPTENPTSRN